MEFSFESFIADASEISPQTHSFNDILDDTINLPLDNTHLSNQVTNPPSLHIEGTNLIQYGEDIPHLQSCPNLTEGMNFPNFEIAIHYCTEFGRFNGFAIRKKRVEKNSDGSIRSRCIDCEYSGKIKDNNKIMIRNKGSKKTECSWHINLSQPLNVDYVRITKFVNIHNHELLPDNTLFASQFRGLSEDIKFDIEHYVKCGVMDLPTIRSLLKPKFPNQFMLSQDLLNYIQKIKRELGNSGSDGVTLLNELFAMQKEDPSFIVIPQIDPLTSRLNGIFWMTTEQQMLYNRYNDVILHDNTALTNRYKWPLSLFVIVDCDNKTRLLAQAFVQDETLETYLWILQCLKRTSIEPSVIITDADPAMIGAIQQELPNTHHVHCIFHIHQNLPRRLKGVLGKDYLKFVSEFYKARNSLSEEIFEANWNHLKITYHQAENYLQNTLYKSKESWASCYTLRLFTAGMQSTQRIEGLNGILHREINASMSLTTTFHKILERLETENMNKRFLTFKHSKTHYFQPLMVTSVFHNVNMQLKEWLSPSLCAEHQKQICEASTYRAKLIENNEISNELLHQEEFVLENQINPELINKEDDSAIATFIEDQYEDKKILLKNLLQEFNIDDICEIWQVRSLLAHSPNSCQYVIIFKNGWHACTCLLLINHGVICRHYFKVMMESNFAKFHINMIPKRWYKEHLQSDLIKINNSPVVTLDSGNTSINFSEGNQLIDFDFTQKNVIFNQNYQPLTIQSQVSKKKEYAILTGLSRKASQLAVEDGDSELKDLLNGYIRKRTRIREEQESNRRLKEIDNVVDKDVRSIEINGKIVFESNGITYATDEINEPLEHVAKGRPANKRLKSSIEISKSGKENANRKEYVCSKCKEIGHNARTCKK